MPAEYDPLKAGLPTDEFAERFLIATAIEHENRLREAIVSVRPEHFCLEAHRIIWRWACATYDAGLPVSSGTLIAHFSTGTGVAELGAIGGYSGMLEFTAPAIDIPLSGYIKQILDTYARRCLMLKCNDALSRLTNRLEDIEVIAREVEDQARLSAVIGKESSGFKNFEDMIRESGGFEAFLRRGKGDALSYPWPALNDLTRGGMRAGQFIVIAGPSGKGKTNLVLNMIFRAAYGGAGIPLMFSLEMPIDEIGARMLALSSSVDSYRFESATAEERDRLRTGRAILAENQYLVDEEDSVTMSAIRAKVKNQMSRGPVSLVVIDTIQLVEGKSAIRENREQEVARITRGMKRMAMQLKLPVVGLSQITDLETNKEPELKNLRESRAIGHNANMVMFLHFTRPYDIQNAMPVGELDLIVAKNRSGPEGRIKLDFHAPTGRFYEREGMNR